MKKIHVWLIVALSFFTIATLGFAQEEWKQQMKKDFVKVLKEKKKQAEKHREFIAKWQKAGHLDDLINLYETEKTNHPDNAAFYYGLGYTYARSAPTENRDTEAKAIAYFEKAIELDVSLFWAHFNLAVIYKKQAKDAQALSIFRTSLDLNPKYYPIHYYMGEIYLKLGKHAEALQAFESAHALNRKWAYPIYGKGLVYMSQGDLNLAREAFEHAILRDRKFAPAYIKLGQILAKERFFDAALAEYGKSARYQPYTTKDVFELAVIFAEQDNTEGAIELYQRAIEIDATYTPAHFALGEIFYAQGDVTAAVNHYHQAIAVDPSLKNAFFEPVAPYFAGAMPADEARALLEKMRTVLPDDPRSYFYLAKLDTDADNIEAAITNYQKTLELIEAEPSYLQMELPLGHFQDSHLNMGHLYHKQGNLEAAAASYKRALELNPELATLFYEKGKTAFEAENYLDALEPLQIHIMLFPEDVEATYLLGQTHEASGDTESALQFYQKTLQLDANRPDVLFKTVYIYRETESHEKALDALEKIIAIEPANAEAHYLSGLSLLTLERHDAALAAFLETVRLAPDNVSAHYNAGKLFEQKKDTDNAIVHYEKTIELDPETAEPFFRLGAIYHEREDEDNVIRVYEPALELEPEHPMQQHALAVIFEKRSQNGAEEELTKNRKKAIHRYGLANKFDPEHFDWHYRYARLLDTHAETLEKYDAPAEMAVHEYTETIKLNGGFADAYFHRGMITYRYKRIGNTVYRYGQILEDFKQVTDLQPKNVTAHYYVGKLLIDKDDYTLAKEAFQKVAELSPKYKGVHLQLGKLAQRDKKWKEAIQLYEKEIGIDDKATEAYQRLGDLYHSSELNYNKAQEILEKALELDDKHVPTILLYANNFFSLDSLGAAADQFERVLQLEPDNLTANFNLALMYEYTERIGQARAQWKRFLDLNPPEQWKLQAEKKMRELGVE